MPIPPDLAWSLSDQIGHAYSILLAVSRDALADAPLAVPEFIALVILQSFPEGLTQTAWGEYQGVTRQRAHKVTSTLAAEGFIEVTKQGRSSTVTLAPAGEALLERYTPQASLALAHALGRLTTKDARELSRLLEKLIGTEGEPASDTHPSGGRPEAAPEL